MLEMNQKKKYPLILDALNVKKIGKFSVNLRCCPSQQRCIGLLGKQSNFSKQPKPQQYYKKSQLCLPNGTKEVFLNQKIFIIFN